MYNNACKYVYSQQKYEHINNKTDVVYIMLNNHYFCFNYWYWCTFLIVLRKPHTTHISQNNFTTQMNHMKVNTFSPSCYSLRDSHTHSRIPSTHWMVRLKLILPLRLELVAMELSGSNNNNAPQTHI